MELANDTSWPIQVNMTITYSVPWPLRMEVTLDMLNQEHDYDHHSYTERVLFVEYVRTGSTYKCIDKYFFLIKIQKQPFPEGEHT